MIPAAKKQLGDWGIDYFDLFLIHFPISLAYVDFDRSYPPGWFGDDGKVHLRKQYCYVCAYTHLPDLGTEDTPVQETWAEMEKLFDLHLAKNIGVRCIQSFDAGDAESDWFVGQ